MTKLLPIDISDCQNISSIIDKCFNIFQNTISYPYSRPKLKEREIYVSLNPIELKAEIFWHIASIEQKSKLEVLPCTNDITVSICKNNCITGFDSIKLTNEIREKCIYRATRVNWIKPIVEMYNSSDPRVKYWEKKNSDKKLRLYLRYQEEENDYLVIFEHKSEKRVVLVTAFPIFYVSSRRDYDKDYETYENKRVS